MEASGAISTVTTIAISTVMTIVTSDAPGKIAAMKTTAAGRPALASAANR
jgi:hypothetical protein